MGSRLIRDERGLIARFILRAVIFFAILIFAAYEGGQILIASIHAHNAAGAGAEAGADFFFRTHDASGTRAAVFSAVKAEDPKAKVVSIDISQDGVVTVETRETASTLLIRRLSFTKDWGVVHGTEEGARSG